MPICDGFELTRKVRHLEEGNHWPPTTIIGISANDQAVITTEAQGAGMDGFMAKPFKLATLLKIVDQIQYRQQHNNPSAFVTHHLAVFRPDLRAFTSDANDSPQPSTGHPGDEYSTTTASITTLVGSVPPASSKAFTRSGSFSAKIHICDGADD